MTTAETTNRYLEGNYAPVSDERVDHDLPVTGAIPPQLAGRLLRNGPNPVAVPDPAAYHWFTGAGMVHGIELRDGRAVSYRNRWVRSEAVSRQLGEAPIAGQPASVFSPGEGVSGNTHVVCHAGRILALVEVELPAELSPELETLGRHDFGGALASPFTAHPKIDPVSGEMVFFGYNIFGPPFLRYHVADATGRLVKSEDITLAGPSMVHDFAITETRVVLFDLPVVFKMDMVGTAPLPFRWDPDYGAHVGVMPRDGGDADVVWIDVEPCYVFHPLNAYDDGDRVVVDVVRYDTMFVQDRHGPFRDSLPSLWRWTIDPKANKVVEEQLDDRNVELPRIDDRLTGRRHRYGYTATLLPDMEGNGLAGLVKYDLATGHTEVHDFGSDRGAGEGVFVAADDGSGEDEGWVLSVVYDAARDASDLVILDASRFAAEPVATVHMPRRVPFGSTVPGCPTQPWREQPCQTDRMPIDFSFAPEVEEVRLKVREFMETEVRPAEEKVEANGGDRGDYVRMIVALRGKAKEWGLWLPHMPPEWGGMGLGPTAMAAVSAEAARTRIGPFVLNAQAPDEGNQHTLLHWATPAQGEKYLRPLCEGTARSCFAMTEPEVAGSDPTLIQTFAYEDGDEWVINGHKWFISGARGAQFAILIARTEENPEVPQARNSAFIVDIPSEGWEVVRDVHTMAGGHNHCEIRITDLRVPKDNMLGDRGQGHVLGQSRLGPARLAHCMRWIAQAETALEMMVDRAIGRYSHGSFLAEKQGIQWLIADSTMELYQCKLMVLHAAYRIENGLPFKGEVSMAKHFVANSLWRIVDRAIQVHGALGYSTDTPLADMLKQARWSRFADGADEVHQMTIARQAIASWKDTHSMNQATGSLPL